MAEAKKVSRNEVDNFDNVSDKYMSLEESAHDGVKECKKFGARVKHQITNQGVESALPEDPIAEVTDEEGWCHIYLQNATCPDLD